MLIDCLSSQKGAFSMATKTVLIDDLDGTEGAETRSFSWNGVDYEVDLNDKNTAKLEKALSPFIAVAREVPRTRPEPTKMITHRPRPVVGRVNRLNEIREWARGQGLKVSDRGKVPKDIIRQYEAAHGGLGPATRG
ncbi:Lsr2-like protein [Mycolicibacterium phlei RIVM601174]|nr:Lsr2-like protein [Mycolicibacterium phlei RIVM601174]